MSYHGPSLKYTDITEQVKQFSFGHGIDSEYIIPEKLYEKCTYILRDNSEKSLLCKILRKGIPNKTISGKLKNVKSCPTAPEIFVEIETISNKIERIPGRLYGDNSNLGVYLDDVLKIE